MTLRKLHLAQPSCSSDADALARVADGDLSALADVFDAHAGALVAFVTRAGAAADAEDIVQMTFMRAAKLAASFDRSAASARPWLMAIASRILLERRRSVARLARALFKFERTVPSPSFVEPARADLERGLARLSTEKRVVLILAEVEQYTCEEIALMLDRPVGTVWTRLHHARKELRAFFTEELE